MLMRAPKNLWVDTFPNPVSHFWAPYYYNLYKDVPGRVPIIASPQENQNIFLLDSSSNNDKDMLEIYNNKERELFSRRRSSKTRKDSLKMIRKSLGSRSIDDERFDQSQVRLGLC